MRICFIIPKYSHNDFSKEIIQTPIGVLYTCAVLRKLDGIDSRVLDLRLFKDTRNAIYQELEKWKPEIIFLLTNTYDLTQCYALSVETTVETIVTLRDYSESPVFLLGAHGTVQPNVTLKETQATGVIRGEYERYVPEFLGLVKNGNLRIRDNLIIYPDTTIKLGYADLTVLPVPAYDLAPMRSYVGPRISENKKKMDVGLSGLIFSSRGCSYGCSYCFNFFGNSLRFRRFSLVIEEIKILYKCYGIKHVFFLDYNFTFNKKWVEKLCRFLIEEGLGISWICQTRCDLVDEKILTLMYQAGCKGIFYGIETPIIFERQVEKNIKQSIAESAINMTSEAGILPMAFLMLGLPNENDTSTKMMTDWITEVDIPFLFSRVSYLPGTKLFNSFFGNDALDHTMWTELLKCQGAKGNKITQKHFNSAMIRLCEHKNNVLNIINS